MVTCGSDKLNANVALTVREICTNIPIVATASSNSEEILKAAGCTHIITRDIIIWKSLARRILAGDAIDHIIGTFDEFVIAESSATNTPMVSKTLKECRIREISGVNVIGFWERGVYSPAGPHTKIGKIQNVGFGNVVDKKNVSVILKPKAGFNTYIVLMNLDARDWRPDLDSREDNKAAWRDLNFSVNMDAFGEVPAGDYDIYLKINDPKEQSANMRCIRFANKGNSWNVDLGANLIGLTTVAP